MYVITWTGMNMQGLKNKKICVSCNCDKATETERANVLKIISGFKIYAGSEEYIDCIIN